MTALSWPWPASSSWVARRISSVAATLPSSNAETPNSSRPSRPCQHRADADRSGFRSCSVARGVARIA